MLRRLSFAVSLVCLMLVLGLGGEAVAASPKTVNDIPQTDAGGLLKRIAGASGKVVVVNVFASWCPPCREEIPGLVRIRREFSEKELVVIGVSVDKEPRALLNYMNEMRMNYPVLLARGDFIQRVGVDVVPQLLIYDKAGELATNHKGLMREADLRGDLRKLLAGQGK